MTEQPLDDVLHETRAFIREEVAGGFCPVEDVPRAAAEYFEGTCDSAVALAAAERDLPTALAAHPAEQASWPAVADCDRLM